MKKSIICALATAVLAGMLLADEENLLKNGDFSMGPVNWVTTGEVLEENGAGALVLKGKNVRAASRQPIPVEDGANYRVSAVVSADKPVSQVLIGLIPLDAKNRQIIFRNAEGALFNTETTLAESFEKGTDTLVIAENALWQETWNKKQAHNIAFNVKADRSDLPNFELMQVKSVATENGKTTVKLTRPTKVAYPAGTALRIHKDGSTYIYTTTIRKGFPGEVKAEGTIGPGEKLKFRPGTASVQAFLLLIPAKAAPDVTVKIRDMKIVKIQKEQ